MILQRKALVLCMSALLVASAFVGCGGEESDMIPVVGTVTLDGAPLEGATVSFLPEEGGRPATGLTDASGQFSLKTFETGDGALIGNHQVSVMKRTLVGEALDEDGVDLDPDSSLNHYEWDTPEKYRLPKTSGLTCVVESGMESPTIALTSGE